MLGFFYPYHSAKHIVSIIIYNLSNHFWVLIAQELYHYLNNPKHYQP